jgi:hypothetical protein
MTVPSAVAKELDPAPRFDIRDDIRDDIQPAVVTHPIVDSGRRDGFGPWSANGGRRRWRTIRSPTTGATGG